MSKTVIGDIKTGDLVFLRDQPIGNLLTGWVVSGIEMARARSGLLCGTAGTCDCDAKGDGQERGPFKAQSTEAQRRGGLTRNSDEGSVMDLEPRSQVALSKTCVNP